MTTRAKSNGNGAKRREVLHAMLVALRDETYERVRELRHEQQDDRELAPGDEMDRARATVNVETHASLIARAEERLRYIDEALGRVDTDRYGICADVVSRSGLNVSSRCRSRASASNASRSAAVSDTDGATAR